MTIEQEARDIVFEMDLHGEGEIKSAIKGIAKALQAKQDRIDELESALKEIAKDEFLSEDCLHAKMAKKALGGGA